MKNYLLVLLSLNMIFAISIQFCCFKNGICEDMDLDNETNDFDPKDNCDLRILRASCSTEEIDKNIITFKKKTYCRSDDDILYFYS